ncbi:MAG: hypothetical protein AAFY71_28580 [Bacteroidota bacterium]
MARSAVLRGLAVIGIIILVLVVAGGIYLYTQNKPLPTGEAGEAADNLAVEMMDAVNKSAWDSTNIVRWSFRESHEHTWDKERDFAQVKWDEFVVNFHVKTKEGEVYEAGKLLEGEKKKELLGAAYSYWVNDGFWLNAVVKAFDPGTTRYLIKNEDGSEDLLVTYGSGGLTPGDSYLWKLDQETKRPLSWQVWASNLPVKGMEFTWESWKELHTGALIASNHMIGSLEINMGKVESADSIQTFFPDGDPFLSLDK